MLVPLNLLLAVRSQNNGSRPRTRHVQSSNARSEFRLTLGYRPLLNRPSGLSSPSFEMTPGVTSATNHKRKWLEEGLRTRLLFVNEPSTTIAFKYPKTVVELPSVKKALQNYPGFALVTHERGPSKLQDSSLLHSR